VIIGIRSAFILSISYLKIILRIGHQVMKKFFSSAFTFSFIFLSIITQSFNVKNANAAQKNPNLVIKTLDGLNFDLEKMRGKVVIVNFWVHWCSNCTTEMMVLDDLYHQYHNQGLEIIGVSVDRKRDLKHVLNRVKNISYPNAMSINAIVNDFPEPDSIPRNYVFDKNGKLQNVNGEDILSKEGLENFIKPLL
jgi:thiol-disulfide isomerase/thioredoxin